MFPPNVLSDEQKEDLHGSYVRRALVKELLRLTENFSALNHLCQDEPGKSIVVACASTFEKPAARCVSIVFDRAVANVAHDNFSHGFDERTTVHASQVNVAGMDVDDAVQSVITAMAEAEPVFGSHVRMQRAAAEHHRQEQAARFADFTWRT